MKSTMKKHNLKQANLCMRKSFLDYIIAHDGLGPDGKTDYCLESVQAALDAKNEVSFRKKESELAKINAAQTSLESWSRY